MNLDRNRISANIAAFMETNTLDFQPAIDLIQRSNRILLVSHRRPDGDTLGASCALKLAFQQIGKTTTLACIDEIPRRLQFIPATKEFVRSFSLQDYDLIIISDAGAYHMTGFHDVYPEFLSKNIPIINIDHHVSNEGYGTVNLVDVKASCATMVVYELLKKLPITVSPEIALALLTGIYNDTGGLMHSNTTENTFQVATELVSTGVRVQDIARALFKESSFEQLRLWGHILENIRMNEKNILSSVVNHDDLSVIGARSSDTGGIIDLMNTVPEASYAILLAEDDGWVKGSLRTQREDVNVSDIAGQFGGGGHKKAAGFRMKGSLQKQVVWKIVPE